MQSCLKPAGTRESSYELVGDAFGTGKRASRGVGSEFVPLRGHICGDKPDQQVQNGCGDVETVGRGLEACSNHAMTAGGIQGDGDGDQAMLR